MSTGIEWTDETWNPIRARNTDTGGVGHFCEKVSPACKHCYAEVLQKRYFNNPIHYGAGDRDKVELFLDEKTLLAPLKWKRARMVFPCSMTDLFGEWVPPEWINKVFAVMQLCPQHTFQVLTKRTARMAYHLNDPVNKEEILRYANLFYDNHVRTLEEAIWNNWDEAGGWPMPNVWLGTSVEDQLRADERIPHLLRCRAAVRWLSCEPLLGATSIRAYMPHEYVDASGHGYHGQDDPCVTCGVKTNALHWVSQSRGVEWVVCGGESGTGYRALNLDHARSLREQCAAAGVPFFFKQVGGHTPKAGGRLLDGVVHDAMPVTHHLVSA